MLKGKMLLVLATVIFISNAVFAGYDPTWSPKNTSANTKPVRVETISEPGHGDDRYVVFIRYGSCSPRPGCWSSNPVTQAAINQDKDGGKGLHGIYECIYQGSTMKTTVKLMIDKKCFPKALRVKW